MNIFKKNKPMSPLMDRHEKSNASSNTLNDISLLSSQPNDTTQASSSSMDLFMNQTPDYRLPFDQQQQQNDALHGHYDLGSTQQLLSTQPQHNMNDMKDGTLSHEITPEQFEFAKPNQPVKKGKQKSKEGGHSSLLHVFTNPLLHAIPILARNFSNFEDFLAQTTLPGQSLLGPGDLEEEQETNFTSPTMSTSDTPWHIRVLGLPHTGAKSRVETQIKICIQLADTAGELVTNWSHIKLPEHLVAKDKLKRKNQKYGTDEKASLIDTQVLTLEAAVVCDGQPDNEIIMCTSCVHRERKRLKRKRDNKVARAASKEGGAAKLAALFANDLPDLNDEKVMAEERRRILLFNCNEYVEFNTGEATLPTRVTCYCRHHSEKKGFRIVFTLKDNSDHVIATGRSPPIMITDDHKSSKMQQAAAKKRTRADLDASATESDAPSSSRKKVTLEAETDSGVSSPIVSTPATPSSQPDETPEKASDDTEKPSTVTPSSNLSNMIQMNNNNNPQHPLQQQHTFQHHISQGELFDFLNSSDLNLLQTNTNPHPHSHPHLDHNQQLPLLQPDHQQQQILSQFNNQQMINSRNRRLNNNNNNNAMNQNMYQQQQQYGNQVYTKLQERNAIEGSKAPHLPRLHRLIPSEGPIYGGAEVTVLGSNFYEGLTCLFGENPAIPTHCWSTNTLLCILPPAASAGPVVVSFKEHPLMLEGQDVVLFTYFDESDRALMELALQVVGLKTMGKVEDARQIAMRIVQGDNSSRKDSQQQQQQSNHRHSTQFKLTTMASTAIYENARKLFLSKLEEHVIDSLLALSHIKPLNTEDYISLTNDNQHSLLHLAAICGYTRLVETLVKLKCDVDLVDKNGFTALHFASWSGKVDIVELLIDSSNLKIVNRVGKTAEKLAIEAGHKNIVQLFKKKHQRKIVSNKLLKPWNFKGIFLFSLLTDYQLIAP